MLVGTEVQGVGHVVELSDTELAGPIGLCPLAGAKMEISSPGETLPGQFRHELPERHALLSSQLPGGGKQVVVEFQRRAHTISLVHRTSVWVMRDAPQFPIVKFC